MTNADQQERWHFDRFDHTLVIFYGDFTKGLYSKAEIVVALNHLESDKAALEQRLRVATEALREIGSVSYPAIYARPLAAEALRQLEQEQQA